MSDTSLCTPISRHNSRHPSLRLNTSDALSFIPPSLDVEANSDTDSLFDEIMHDTLEGTFDSPPTDLCGLLPARLIPPPIPGLFFKPTALTQTCADEIMHSCLMRYFRDGHDQVMLFERLVPTREDSSLLCVSPISKLPAFLTNLLLVLSQQLLPILPPDVHALLFPPAHEPPRKARQVIINAYLPGEGITPHVDLLDRYDDGIVGVSLGSGSVMQFRNVSTHKETTSEEEEQGFGVYLPPGSAYVMSGEARYDWTHGIEGRVEDWVLDEDDVGSVLPRTFRVSVTFRWLLPGADCVGRTQSDASDSA